MTKFVSVLLEAFVYEPWLVFLCAAYWGCLPWVLLLGGKALWLVVLNK